MNALKNIAIIICIVTLISSCKKKSSKSAIETSSKKVLFINSYHTGYGSSDDILEGIKSVFDTTNALLETFNMDTKRYNSADSITSKTSQAIKIINSFNPDLVIASDDNAVKHVATQYKNKTLPIIFCGVNWTCDQYGLPTKNITGMLEVLPLKTAVDSMLNYYPDAKNIMVLSENTVSEEKNKLIVENYFASKNMVTTFALVDNFSEWKTSFIEGNKDFDIIYTPTNGAIKEWDHEVAVKFVSENIKKPIFTCDDFMMPYAVFGLTKIAKEQGEWAAETALNVLNGTDISTITVTENKKSKLWFNEDLASKIALKPSEELKKSATLVK